MLNNLSAKFWSLGRNLTILQGMVEGIRRDLSRLPGMEKACAALSSAAAEIGSAERRLRQMDTSDSPVSRPRRPH